jgi:phosphatidylinositol kinase/protein kinase (PI-3  family)
LNEFVRACALPYLEDDDTEVRRAAALTCCRLFVRDPIVYQSSSHAIEIISDVLDKLLTVGIADPGIRNRTSANEIYSLWFSRSYDPTYSAILAS